MKLKNDRDYLVTLLVKYREGELLEETEEELLGACSSWMNEKLYTFPVEIKELEEEP